MSSITTFITTWLRQTHFFLASPAPSWRGTDHSATMPRPGSPHPSPSGDVTSSPCPTTPLDLMAAVVVVVGAGWATPALSVCGERSTLGAYCSSIKTYGTCCPPGCWMSRPWRPISVPSISTALSRPGEHPGPRQVMLVKESGSDSIWVRSWTLKGQPAYK